MQALLQRQHPFRTALKGVGLSLVLTLALCGAALAQQIQVSGFVTTTDGQPLEGVTVGVQQSDARARTDLAGRYEITAPANGSLFFSLIGYRAIALDIANRTRLDVILERSIAVLDEMIVTGYTEQRRADITGAVSSVDIESVARQTSTSVLQRLDGRIAGVTVDASGQPGSRSTVRIRGVSSFQNNDPLYIIDGTPVEDTYINWLNANDIASIQVLKDASSASIYGSRATNGVVIIETSKRGQGAPGESGPRFTIDTKVGVARPVRGYDDFLILDALTYAEVVKQAFENAGFAVPENIYGDPDNPTIPSYIWPNDGTNQTNDLSAFGLTEDDYLWGNSSQPNREIMPASTGTNWWDAVFSPALVSDVNLSLAGSGETHGYNVSFNYLDQDGTAAFNRFQRGSLRANTQFVLGRFNIGENLAIAYERSFGGTGEPGGYAEDGIMGKNILHQPVVPIYDIGGNYAAGKAVTLGNQGNPLKQAWSNKDDINTNLKIFGNVYGGFDLTDALTVNTRFGWNLNEFTQFGYDPADPELSEPSYSTGINENFNLGREWTWTNTLNFRDQFGPHGVSLLVGQEASKNRTRYNNSNLSNLVSETQDARYIQDALGSTKNVNSGGSVSALLSFFGKFDYNYAERYYLSATLRRDGSSRLGPNSRWGTFPAFSLGWRLSQEAFLRDNQFFTNVMLRFGWGITGNQNIPAGRTVGQYGGSIGGTYYAISGGNTVTTGYRLTSIGNPDLKWEENKSMNVGLDLEFFGGSTSLVIDAYERKTDNLLFNPGLPATAGVASAPIVNIGEMQNRGIDVSLGYTGTVGTGGTWNVTFNASHYKNEIVRIDGVQEFFFGPVTTRYGNQVINHVGYPIGAFYGLEWDGYFETQADADDYSLIDPSDPDLGCPVACQDGAAPGRLKFVDQPTDNDGDGVIDGPDGRINANDRVVIGSPHPDLTAGLDFGLNLGAWDFSATLAGAFGNDIWDVQKEFYVFRNFSTNVRSDLLDYSAEVDASGNVTNMDVVKYPRIDVSDTFSGQQLSSYYLEDGSYIRLRNLQIGYRLPATFAFLSSARVYLQGENLFTLTGYTGLDPVLPAANVGGAGGDIRDQYRGVDRGAYPANKTISAGISVTF
jgi:TonB-linked SusC/RagA family outer membrane protein